MAIEAEQALGKLDEVLEAATRSETGVIAIEVPFDANGQAQHPTLVTEEKPRKVKRRRGGLVRQSGRGSQ